MNDDKKFEKTKFPGFVKDAKHGVIIQEDLSEYQRILDKRNHKKELDRMNNEVASLQKELKKMQKIESELDELKLLIKSLSNK